MRKIRIGNDICLSVRLFTGYGDNRQKLNIRSVKAYLVNTTLQSNINNRLNDVYAEYDTAVRDQQGRIKYISRFPIEPMSDCYHSTLYDICNSGCPTYNVLPTHYRPAYNGFGVYPHTFDGFKNHVWAYDDFRELKDKIHRTEKQSEFDSKFITYQARVEFTTEQNIVKIYFPGEDLREVGSYKLVIVTEVYVNGYSNYTNIKTLTLDYGNVVEIVKTTEEGEDAVTVEIGVQDTSYENATQTGDPLDLHVTSSHYNTGNQYNISSDGTVNLTLNDGTSVPIDLSSEVSWYEDNTEYTKGS